jgi:polar amino acid transport system substrate-binding protein
VRIHYRLSAAMFLGLSLSATTGYCADIRFITEPTGNVDAAGRSFSTESELTRDLIRRLNHDGDVEVYPWKRAYSLLQTEPNIALFPTTRTEARENDAKWVGPILKVSWVLYANEDSSIELNSLEDAMKVKRICGYLGDAKLKYLEEKGFTNLITRYRSFDCAELLKKNRLDLWVGTSNAIIPNSETSSYEVTGVKVVYTMSTRYLYYALSKDIPDETVKLLQETINDMKKDGAFYKFYRGHYSENMIQGISKIEEPVFPWETGEKISE